MPRLLRDLKNGLTSGITAAVLQLRGQVLLPVTCDLESNRVAGRNRDLGTLRIARVNTLALRAGLDRERAEARIRNAIVVLGGQQSGQLVEGRVDDLARQLAADVEVRVLVNCVDEVLLLHSNSPLKSVA